MIPARLVRQTFRQEIDQGPRPSRQMPGGRPCGNPARPGAGAALRRRRLGAANFTDPDARSDAQRATLAGSDTLVEEVRNADVWVIATPIYNFGVPASLKAWVDQIARARLTFRYTEQWPQGLLQNRKVYILTATGGTEVGSAIDFATPWLKFVLGFLGIRDVGVIAA